MHTFRVYYILTCVGIDSVRSIEKAVVGQSHGTGSSRYPVFRMWFNKGVLTILTLGYQSEHIAMPMMNLATIYDIESYVSKVNADYQSKDTTEHSFRGTLR